MIEKTGIIYSENSDLSSGTYSGTVEESGERSALTIPYYPMGVDLYVKAYCVDSEDNTYESSIHRYMLNNYFHIKNEYAGDNEITITTVMNSTTPPDQGTYAETVELSKDSINWTTYNLTPGTHFIITLHENEYLFFRNDTGYWNTFTNHYNLQGRANKIKGSQIHSVGGRIETLLKYTSVPTLTLGCFFHLFHEDDKLLNTPELSFTTVSDYCYYGMFTGCISITTPPSLPATDLSNTTYCYGEMFSGCTSLNSTPVLPATTLGDCCYYHMFEGCTSITTAPSLPATTATSFCYNGMFKNCSSLATTPTLPATIPATAANCYEEMFQGCTSITTAQNLNSTTLAYSCYRRMFQGCTSLVNIPSTLPATTMYVNCYAAMFGNCTSITTAPSLPATRLTTSCYGSMFAGCSSLNEVRISANNISATGCLDYWLSNVSATGTFHKLGTANFPSGASGIPSGWTVVTT